MEEKVLIRSQRFGMRKFIIIMMLVGLLIGIIPSVMLYSREYEWQEELYAGYCYNYESKALDHNNVQGKTEIYNLHRAHKSAGECTVKNGRPLFDFEQCAVCGYVEFLEKYPTAEAYAREQVFESYYGRWSIASPIISTLSFALISLVIYLWLRSYELTVTDKRIYGRVAWGKRVDLPVDSVSAIATVSFLKGIAVSTSSGKISFRLIKNADDIYETINGLVIKRQQEKTVSAPVVNEIKTDEADKLLKFKNLLDQGIISQEEFDAKKKQLLGL